MRARTSRVIALCSVMLLVMAALVYRMIQLQLIQGPNIAADINTNVIRQYDEIASRGEILDRDGNVMVGNALVFSVQLDYYRWDKSAQNEVILRLHNTLQEAGLSCSDVLPLNWEMPLRYTYESLDSGDGRKLKRFLEAQEWPSVEELTPTRLFGLLCDRYEVDTDLPLEARRAIVGLRYYLEDYQFSGYNTPVTVVEALDITTVAHISEQSNQMPGVTIQVSDSREYETTAAAQLLGYVGTIPKEDYEERKDQGYTLTDTIGRAGMERALEDYLRGIDGIRVVEADSRTGQLVTEYMVEEPQPGKNCYLTISLPLQERTEQALAETIENIRIKGEASKEGDGADVEGGAAIVMDVNTGEILAMASYPTYDLSRFWEDYTANSTNPLSPFLNRTIQSTYSPGSTFKMCTSLAALEEGVITPRTEIVDKGAYERYADVGYSPRCWVYRQYGRTHGAVNVSEALKYSCNYFFYEMGYQLQMEKLNSYATQLGLGQKTGIELPNEKAGILAGPESREARGGEKWYAADTLMAAIGQSDHLFTPIQLVNYVATIVNGGTRYQPHLLKTVMDYTNTEVYEENEPVVLNEVEISESFLDAIKEGMKGVVTEDGTASSYFAGFPIQVGGKTGSAQMTNHSATGVFVSFAPYDNPEIAVCVVGEYASSGGSLAPVAIAIYDEYFGLNLNAVE